MSDNLDVLIQAVAKARQQLDDQKEAIEAIQAEIEDTDLGAQLRFANELKAATQGSLDGLVDKLKTAGLAAYDGENKQVHPAVTIKSFKKIGFDVDEMKTWAIKHQHPALLNLNKSAANKVGTGPTAPDFVTVSYEDRAQVKGDLSDYL